MILRRVMAHVRAQNWLAVALDFLIVVVGVFIGIQLGNWNEVRAFRTQERGYLIELRNEIAFNVSQADHRTVYSRQVVEGVDAVLAFLEDDEPCAPRCRELLISAFHASQVWGTPYSLTINDQIQRLGLPTDDALRRLVRSYYETLEGDDLVAADAHPFRAQMRGTIDTRTALTLWQGCYEIVDNAFEILGFECAEDEGLSETAAALALERLRLEDRVAENLRFWAGQNILALEIFPTQQATGREALAALGVAIGSE
ncbi:hypothetical protein E5163_01755 [Marinicauda algicola]|uniref:Uncharacterized protein n=1 Tax=Marinicauda algicola TaxID=2029849 RepID=A0A4S2H2Q1_9PROT|nr:hypothetical protein [Marinicauda algicola]TGY89890.1 hypothetical protein E5163_01755 [Marinicauda algicola]